ncbi:Putative membrane protein [Croceitalea dokdonensis DOKDO 023]|uniref:Putative membrane protein n=1 Tax=Croceitalea dokdonensis DOKDO 023 TaxID=1300341 RepID=A0A0P7AWC9_9FLAO|nr:MFS transporter [Croceitalea dokdonensis]KPM32290.1 Putative membrane protein [Croceitalea dokdonensis DOKDO 023]
MKSQKYTLPIIVLAQFCCTSLWFASNAVILELGSAFGLENSALANLTSAVQLGFILGTLVFAIFMITDRFSPSKVFFACASIGALFNLALLWNGNELTTLLGSRFATGFFLAGIYPVGMKIAADYFDTGLGRSLGYLVGALVVGTSFPHALKGLGVDIPWTFVVATTSGLAVLGGLLILFVPNGPYRKPSQKLNFSSFFSVFKLPKFRAAAFGYFGHMWELYTFWAFVPLLLALHSKTHGNTFSISFWSFIVIAVGGLACVLGGYLSQRFGIKKVALVALALSGLCCLLSPVMLTMANSIGFLLFLCFWGMVVIADSPLFSTLVASNADPRLKGTALTIVNCIGFAITIVSIQFMGVVQQLLPEMYSYMVLAIGPVLGFRAAIK